MEMKWPLFWCISQEARVALMKYQWEHFGLRLNIPPEPFTPVSFSTQLESLEEIDRMMRQKPHRPRRGV